MYLGECALSRGMTGGFLIPLYKICYIILYVFSAVHIMLLPLVLVFKMCLRHWSVTSFLSYALPPRLPPKETPVSAPEMAQREE